jgi:hypothetical protein
MRLFSVFFLATILAAQAVAAQIDLDAPEIRADRAKYEAMRTAAQREAEGLSAVAVYNELERIDAARSSRIALDPGSLWVVSHRVV